MGVSEERSHKRRSPLLAVTLSGLFPGLGQLYNRQPGKAAAFFIAGILTAFGPWNPIETDIPLDDVSVGLRQLLLASLPFFAAVLWSIVDAYRVARATSRT